MTVDTRKIKISLCKRGLTGRALSKAAGVTASTVSTVLKRGTCAPATAEKLAQALGIPVEELIGGDE